MELSHQKARLILASSPDIQIISEDCSISLPARPLTELEREAVDYLIDVAGLELSNDPQTARADWKQGPVL